MLPRYFVVKRLHGEASRRAAGLPGGPYSASSNQRRRHAYCRALTLRPATQPARPRQARDAVRRPSPCPGLVSLAPRLNGSLGSAQVSGRGILRRRQVLGRPEPRLMHTGSRKERCSAAWRPRCLQARLSASLFPCQAEPWWPFVSTGAKVESPGGAGVGKTGSRRLAAILTAHRRRQQP